MNRTIALYGLISFNAELTVSQYTGPWTPQSHKSEKSILAQRQLEAEKEEGKKGQDAFLKALPPTYLHYDTEGRVIRMDVSIQSCMC